MRQAFDRAADSYDEFAVLQHEVCARLLEKLEIVKITPQLILDAGTGTGSAIPGLYTQFKKSQPVALDLSENMLTKAASHGNFFRSPHCVCADIENLPFANESFDLIFHPVSNCYVEDVYHIWNECYRILKKGGVLLAGMDNGMSFLVNDEGKLPLVIVNKLPFNPLRNASEKEYKRMVDKYEGIQFSHSLEEQIGGQLKAGFMLVDMYEDRDRDGCGILREYTPQYIATKSIKR